MLVSYLNFIKPQNVSKSKPKKNAVIASEDGPTTSRRTTVEDSDDGDIVEIAPPAPIKRAERKVCLNCILRSNRAHIYF